MTSVSNYTKPKQVYIYSLFLEQKYENRQRGNHRHVGKEGQRREWNLKKKSREKTESEKLSDGDKETERDRKAKGKQREMRVVMRLDGKKDRKNIQKVETICRKIWTVVDAKLI